MTSSIDDLTKVSKKRFPAFTQFDDSIFVKNVMHDQEQVKWRPAT